MHLRRLSFAALVLAVCGASCLAAVADAKPSATKHPRPALKMLPRVGCQGLLTISDFPGTAIETTLAGGVFGSVEESPAADRTFFTTCQFTPPETGESTPETEAGVGVDELAVYPRIEFESQGRRHELIADLPQALPGSRYELHGVGTRAYFVIDEEGGAEGYLQVRNDVFFVVRDQVAGIRGILSTVASELCPRCIEAEVPRASKHK